MKINEAELQERIKRELCGVASTSFTETINIANHYSVDLKEALEYQRSLIEDKIGQIEKIDPILERLKKGREK